MTFLLAADELTGTQVRQILLGSLIVIALLIAAFVVVAQVKRRLNQVDESSVGKGAGFTLSDLRQMHKSGQMSDREFELAKAKIVEAARRASERDHGEIRERRQAHQTQEVETKRASDENGDQNRA